MEDSRTYLELKTKKLKRAVLVRNLHPGTTKETLLAYFSQYGPTEQVVLQHAPEIGNEYVREAALLMKYESDASRIVSQGTHQVSDLTTAARTLSYLGNEKRLVEKGRFKLKVLFNLLSTVGNDPKEQERVGKILCDLVWTRFNPFSMTSFQLTRSLDIYQGYITVRFASEEQKAEIIEAATRLPFVTTSCVWLDKWEPKESNQVAMSV